MVPSVPVWDGRSPWLHGTEAAEETRMGTHDAFYEQAVIDAQAEYERTAKEAAATRNAVIRSAVEIGRLDKGRIAELMGLHRNTVAKFSGQAITEGQPLLYPPDKEGETK